jgi:hypothetical protein
MLLKHVLENGVDNWKLIAKNLGLRNGQDAINEFLKIKSTSAVLGKDAIETLKIESYMYLVDHARSLAKDSRDKSDI